MRVPVSRFRRERSSISRRFICLMIWFDSAGKRGQCVVDVLTSLKHPAIWLYNGQRLLTVVGSLGERMGTFDLDLIGGRKTLALLIDAVCAAGEHALWLASQGAAARAQIKADQSPVTEADKAVEAALRAFATKHMPKVGFLGEEEGETKGENEIRFVVDPIDGTRTFMRGLDGWSTLVGLEYKGEPVIGIANLPARNEIFVAVQGEGATCNGRPIHVSMVGKLKDSLVAHGGLQFAEAKCMHVLDKLATQTYTQRGLGDFLSYRAVAMGLADGAIDPALKPWDMCAPAVIVREAGGRFTSLSGEETIYGGGALASNGLVHDELVGFF